MRKGYADQPTRDLVQQVWSLEDQLDGATEGQDTAELERLLGEHRGKLRDALMKHDERLARHHPKVQALMDAAAAENAKRG